jgi:L-malate glycosyltransferase
VLHVIGQLVPGGSEKMTLQVARQLRAAGDDHRIAVLGELDEDFVSSVGGSAVPLLRVGLTDSGPTSGVKALGILTRAARRHRVEVVQGHAWRSSALAGAIGRLAGIPAVATLHRVYYPRSERLLDGRLQRLWRTVIVDSAAVRDLLVREVGLEAGRVRVVANFVDPELFDLPFPDRTGDAPMRVLLAAHFTEVKGHRFALEALSQIDRKRPGSLELDLLGTGPLLESCRRRARELGVGHLAHFHWSRSDLGMWIARADVILLPSLWEGFGVILAEAMAAGRPVVAFDVGGAVEVIARDETGFLTPPGDVQGLVGALGRLRDDAVLRARMGEAGRLRAARLYSVDTAVPEYQRVYSEAVASR